MSDLAQRIAKVFAPWNRTDAPGLVVGVARHGRLLYRAGFGMASLEAGAANTPATRMRIASVSKHFTSLLALLLAEEGLLDIDAQIRTYLPELTGPGGDPTLRQLMQHRGGSRCFLDLGFLVHGTGLPPIGTAVAMQARQRGRNFAPGQAMIYNNGGYHLLSHAIARVSGVPFATLLRDRLLLPVGMFDTELRTSDFEIIPGAATMHLRTPAGGWERGLFPTEELLGEGGLVSTVDDMLRWMAHLRSPRLFGSAATWQALETPGVHGDGSAAEYALGLMVKPYRGLRTVGHAGGAPGGSSQMISVPAHDLDIIIIINGAPDAHPERLAEQVIDIVLAEEVGPVVEPIRAEAYAGLLGDWWSHETGMVYSLVDQGGELCVQTCKYPLAAPMTRDPEGRPVLAERLTGAQGFALDAALDSGKLAISSAGRTTLYDRALDDAAVAARFVEAAAGRYYSHDADATATITAQGETFRIVFADAFGRVDAALSVCGPDMGQAFAPALNFSCAAAVALTREAGAVTGFRVNTNRTRNLEFTRV